MPPTDRNLVGRSVDLLLTFMTCDATPEKLKFALSSLANDRVRRNEKGESPIDAIISDFSKDIINAIDSVAKRETVKRTMRTEEDSPTEKVAPMCARNRDDDDILVSEGGEDEEEGQRVDRTQGASSGADSAYEDVPSESTRKYVKRHSSKSRTIECDVCGRHLSSKSLLNRHKITHLDDDEARRIHKCNICEKRFSDAATLRRHMVHHMGEDDPRKKALQCDVCGKELSSPRSLQYHKTTHLTPDERPRLEDRDRPYECTVCSQRFLLKHHMQNHRRVHLEGEAKLQFPCIECDQQFAKEESLRAHQLFHLPNDDPRKMEFTCDICGRFVSTKQSLQLHKATHLDANDVSRKPYGCDVCDRRFTHKHRLRQHMELLHLAVEQEKKFKCEQCCRCFKNNVDLKRHSISHLDYDAKFAFNCDECGKRFRLLDDLNIHSITHLPDTDPRKKDLQCDVCRIFYSSKWVLWRHKQIHLDETNPEEAEKKRPFKCVVCGLALRSSQGLKNHMNTQHNNDDAVKRPHECGICGKRFTEQGFKYHENSHLPDDDPRKRKLACDKCDRTFTARQALANYKLTHLPVDDPRRIARKRQCDGCGMTLADSRCLTRHKPKCPGKEKRIRITIGSRQSDDENSYADDSLSV